MTRKQLADAFNRLAEAAALVSIELEAEDTPETDARPAPAQTAAPAPSTGAAVDTTVCPIHRVPFMPSKNEGWSDYCREKGGDPAWTNAKGYCSMKPKDVAQYLRIKAQAA